MNGRWKRALIIGASSGIGEAIAKQLAQQGCKVALVARRETELLRIAAPLNATQPQTALTYVNDVRSIESIPELFNRITHELGGLDLVIYASGVMPMLAEGEFSTHKDRQMIDTNFLGAVAWLNEAGDRFVKMKSGTIVGISSVAGDRGRQGHPVYGATKAALNSYLESLYNRMSKLGVKVVNVKPGPVHTPMTSEMIKMPMAISADQAASEILSAAARGTKVAYVPWRWRPIMWIIRSIPSFLFKRLSI